MKNFCKHTFIVLALLFAGAANAQKIPVWKLKDLQAAMQSDKPTVINFWATFCKPCLEEMPHFQEMARKYKEKGVEFVFVNLDVKAAYPKKITAVMAKRQIKGNVVFLDETDADLFCPVVDEKWSGAIPATVFINGKKGYKKFVEDQLTKADLEKEIASLME